MCLGVAITPSKREATATAPVRPPACLPAVCPRTCPPVSLPARSPKPGSAQPWGIQGVTQICPALGAPRLEGKARQAARCPPDRRRVVGAGR